MFVVRALAFVVQRHVASRGQLFQGLGEERIFRAASCLFMKPLRLGNQFGDPSCSVLAVHHLFVNLDHFYQFRSCSPREVDILLSQLP